MKYIIGNPIITNGEIVGYEITDSNNNIRRLKISDVIKLIETGETNCKVVSDYNDNKHILFKERINTTDNAVYTVEGRLIQDGTVWYKCKSSLGSSVRLKPYKVWELAAQDRVTNIKAIVVNNTLAIVGKELSIKELPVLQV